MRKYIIGFKLICKTMIREPQEKEGLGNPPRKAYSNMSEVVNHILSVHCPGPQPVISFVQAVLEEVQSQQDEVIKALYGRGEYKLCSEYKHPEVSKEDWFLARPEQQQKYEQQINKLTMEELISQKTIYFPRGQKTHQSEGTVNKIMSGDTEEKGMSLL